MCWLNDCIVPIHLIFNRFWSIFIIYGNFCKELIIRDLLYYIVLWQVIIAGKE